MNNFDGKILKHDYARMDRLKLENENYMYVTIRFMEERVEGVICFETLPQA